MEPKQGRKHGNPELITAGEVARLFGVDPKTVTRWAKQGKLEHLMTRGGHRRYSADGILALIEASTVGKTGKPAPPVAPVVTVAERTGEATDPSIPPRRCYRCRGTEGDIVPVGFGLAGNPVRHMHAFGSCTTNGLTAGQP